MNFNQINKNKAFNVMTKLVDDLINKNELLTNRLNDFSKDEEVQKYKEKYEMVLLNSLHILSDEEKQDADAFKNEHWDKCKGNTSYLLTGTGIGTAVEVICTKCGTKKDITDIGDW